MTVTILKGRRLADDAIAHPATGLEPGDYGRYMDGWGVVMPDGTSGVLCEAHRVTERASGEITVWPCIENRESGLSWLLLDGEWHEHG